MVRFNWLLRLRLVRPKKTASLEGGVVGSSACEEGGDSASSNGGAALMDISHSLGSFVGIVRELSMETWTETGMRTGTEKGAEKVRNKYGTHRENNGRNLCTSSAPPGYL